MINLITGKAGSGKTVTIYDTLLSKASENNIIITNPQSIESYELFLANNNVAATIISINDAPSALAAMLGITYKKTATTIEKTAIISDVIRNSSGLSVIKPKHYSTGIVDKLLNTITDLKREFVSGDSFAKWAENAPYASLFGKKISDIAYVMKKYDEVLESKDLVTEEDLLWQVAEHLESNVPIICDNLFIDTLPGYLSSTTYLICSLLNSAENIYIAFRTTDSKAHDFYAFSDSVKAMEAVRDYADAHGYSIKNMKATRKTNKAKVKDLGSGIDIISANFFDRNTKVRSNDPSVKLFEASTCSREVEIVCSEIKRLISAGQSYDDIVVASPKIEDYFPIIQQMFNDNDVPFHYFKNDNLTNTQLFNMINVLLECCYDGVTLPRIMQIVQLNFLSFTASEVALMDSFNKRFGDDESIALNNCEKYDPESYPLIVDIINKVRENIEFFSGEISSSKTVRDYLSTIVNTLVVYNVNESLYEDVTKLYSGNEYQMCNDVVIIWNSFIEVVNTINNISGDSAISLEDFSKYFEKICHNKKLVNNNKYFGEVRVVSLPDVTNSRSKHLFVLGCNEGSLISVPDETFFSAIEKNNINNDLNISIPENEYFISKKIADIYSAFTSPYNTLVLSWATFNNSFNPMERASIIDSIYKIFQENVMKEDEYSKATGEADFLAFLCDVSECARSEKEATPEMKAKYAKYSELPMFKNRLAAALHNMSIRKDRFDTTVKNDDSNIELSVTRAERYNECPFKHFVSFNLSPREQKMFEETQANKGTYYHSIFCKFYTYLKDNKIDCVLLARDRDRFNDIIDGIISDVQNDHNENVLNSSPKLKFTAAKMRETAKVSVWNSLRQISAGDFRPEMMEFNVGKASLLTFDLSNGQKAIVTGIIDRVDVCTSNNNKYARIIDYKSGNTTFSKEKAELGIQLQLPMYMSALKDYEFGGMYYFHIHNPYSEDEISTNEFKNFKLSGPTLGDNGIPEMSDINLNAVGCSVTSEIINVSKTTKDEYSKRSDLLSADEAQNMLKAAQEKFVSAAEGIISGCSDAAPAKTKTFSPCTYCKYKAMCSR